MKKTLCLVMSWLLLATGISQAAYIPGDAAADASIGLANGGGTAPPNSTAVGGYYWSSPPALTNGLFGGLSLDANHNLNVDISGVNISGSGGSTPAYGVGLPVYEADTYTVSSSVTSETAFPCLNGVAEAGYGEVSLQFSAVGSGNTANVSESDDGTNFNNAYGRVTTTLYASPFAGNFGLGSSPNGTFFSVPLRHSYFKLAVSTYGSGTITVTAVFRRVGLPLLPPGVLYQSTPATCTNQIPCAQLANKVGQGSVSTEGHIATYSASVIGLAPVAGDSITLFGNASNTVELMRASVSCTATAAAVADVALVKRLAAETGGTTGTAPTVTASDNSDTAVSAPAVYTAAPTSGTTYNVASEKLLVAASSSPAIPPTRFAWTGGTSNDKPIYLRGTAQGVAINFGTAPSGGSCDVNLEWTEQ